MVSEPDGSRQPASAAVAGGTTLDTPFGRIGVAWHGRCLTRVTLDPAQAPEAAPAAVPNWLRAELDAYFADPAHRFGCEMTARGTAFQHRVWALISAIPAGHTRTYGALARDLGSAPRAVGAACRANPLPLAVPCHRVVGARGPGGFAGDSSGRLLAVKRWLLDHEGVLDACRGRD